MPASPVDSYVAIPQVAVGQGSYNSIVSSDTLADKQEPAYPPQVSDAHASAFRTWTLALQRRQLRYFLILLAISLATLLRVSTSASAVLARPFFSAPSPIPDPGTPHPYHPTLVGPRVRFAANGSSTSTSCSTDELLAATKGVKVRPDGASAHPDFSKATVVELTPIEWSFDMPGTAAPDDGEGDGPEGRACEIPRVYSADEACELLGAFGGLYLTGDSFGRHIYSALLMILRGRIDGAVTDFDTTDDCRGEHMFDDGKLCRTRVALDTHSGYEVCGGRAQVFYRSMFIPDVTTYDVYEAWHSRQPKRAQLYSPIFVTAIGAHFNYEFSLLERDWWPAAVDRLSRQYPVPLNLFAGPHKPGANFRPEFFEKQGPHKVRAFKEQVEIAMRAHSPTSEAELGGWRYIDYYAMSEGAVSYDGTHYSMQGRLPCFRSPSTRAHPLHANDAHASAFRTWIVALQRRQLRYFLILLVISLATLLRVFSSSSTAFSHPVVPFMPSYDPAFGTPHTYHPTLVGPRPRFAANGSSTSTSCSTDELLAAIKGVKVRPDGACTHLNFSKVTVVELSPIEWSFDLPKATVPDGGEGVEQERRACEVPRVYSADEACELLGAFGGLYLTGDSFGRHIYSALLMILRGRIDGAVTDFDTTDNCRGEHMFDDGKLCRKRVVLDTHAGHEVCGGDAQTYYRAIGVPDITTYNVYQAWHSRQPKRAQLYSPIFVTAIGPHFDYEFSHLEHKWWPTAADRLSRQYPVPLNLFAGPHKPGDNFRAEFFEQQGPHKVRAFKEQVEIAMRAHSPTSEAELGGWRYIDYYAMSEGAVSYDGAHYSMQVNLEKAHLLLNVLDTLWGEIVESGGMAVLKGDVV
ncbi:hypothetical protein JCM3770_003268 [Rhodotorula araucariae]